MSQLPIIDEREEQLKSVRKELGYGDMTEKEICAQCRFVTPAQQDRGDTALCDVCPLV